LRPWENKHRMPTPRTLCDGGYTNCCCIWGHQLDHPNLAENPKAGSKGPRLARPLGFWSSARSRSCLKLYHPDCHIRILV
jgi:hypothetical protein